VSAATYIILGITGLAGAWWLFGRKSYFVEVKGGRYEYFDDLGAARDYARSHSGAKLYQIPAGGEFDERSAVRMTPNSRKRRRRTRR
jgi:hypothetical protein